jgi:hypothetical protein
MKKWIALLAVVAIVGSSVVVFAQDATKDQPRKEDQRTRARETRAATVPAAAATKPAPGTEMPGMGRMDPASMMESSAKRMEAEVAKKKAEYQVQIDQWKAILKLAEGEKATNTAEAIKKLVAAKEAEMNKDIQAQEERMKQMQESMKKRMEDMKKRQETMKEGAKPVAPVAPAPVAPAPKAAEKPKAK